MKCGISFCKRAALGKDLGRFWPVWVGYILCLAVLQVFHSSGDMTYWYASNLADSIQAMGLLNCAYALAVAAVLFGDQFQSRMCSGIHALPLKREHWFGAHVQAGILFSVIPTALMAAFSELVILRHCTVADGWLIPLYWFAGSNLQFLFFFGLAAFCAMCVGSRFALAVVYAMINGFSMLMFLLVDRLYTPLLYGVVTQSEPFELLCPVGQLASTRFLELKQVKTGRFTLDEFGAEQAEYAGTFAVQMEGWIYILILAALGVVLLLAARGAYRKKKLETAGDFLAVRWLEPVFQVVYTILCAAGFHVVFYLFFGSGGNAYLLVGIGLAVGWFSGRMFLERSTRVLRVKNVIGFALMAAAMAGSMMLTKLDPLGIAGWIPEPRQVERASMSLSHRGEFSTDDPGEIRELMALHTAALSERVQAHPDATEQQASAAYVTLSYHLDNGWIARREYYIPAAGEAGAIAREYGSRLEVVISNADINTEADLRRAMRQVQYISLHGEQVGEEWLTEAFLEELTDAIVADCESGALVQSGGFHPDSVLENESYGDGKVPYLYLDMSGEDFYCYLDIYADCEHVLAVLEKTGVVDALRVRKY